MQVVSLKLGVLRSSQAHVRTGFEKLQWWSLVTPGGRKSCCLVALTGCPSLLQIWILRHQTFNHNTSHPSLGSPTE